MGSMMIRSESEDLQIVVTLIEGLSIPAGVLSYDIQFDDDSTGDPSIFVMVTINDKHFTSRKKHLNELVAFMNEVTRQALMNGVSRWPYVKLIGAAPRTR
jgi:hypothetical protein